MTTHTAVLDVLTAHPQLPADVDIGTLAETVTTIDACAQACTACADACLGEPDAGELTACIRTCLDCADICATTARVLGRLTHPDMSVIRLLVEACAVACRGCAAECDRHAGHHEHCHSCAEACRACEQACHDLLRTIATPRDGT